MNSDKLKGGLKEAKGKVKKAAGELTSDDKAKDKGTADKVAGAIQKGIGEVKDTVKKLPNDFEVGLAQRAPFFLMLGPPKTFRAKIAAGSVYRSFTRSSVS